MDRSWYLDIATQSYNPTGVLSAALLLRRRWLQIKLPATSALYQGMPNSGYCLTLFRDVVPRLPTPERLQAAMAMATT